MDLQKVKDTAIWDLGRTVDRLENVRRPFKDFGKPVEVKNGNYADPLEMSRQTTNVFSSGTTSRRSHSQISSTVEEEEEGESEDRMPEDSDDSDDEVGYDSAEESHVTVQRQDGSLFQVEKPK